MKTKEELNKLKTEYAAMNEKLAELTEEELELVTGGVFPACNPEIAPPVNDPSFIEAPPSGLP